MREGNKMQFHQIADLFPLMEGEQFRNFVADIKENGLINPIYIYEGQILDGRNRYNACLKLGIEPRYVKYTGDDPVGFVISKNLHRRHLNAYQRAKIALIIMKQLESEIKVGESIKKRDAAIAQWEKKRAKENGIVNAAYIERIIGTEIRKEHKKDAQSVYFLESNGKIKIGVSAFPEDRVKHFQTGNPDVSLIGYIPGSYDTEKELLAEFPELKLGREWLQKTPDLMKRIKELMVFFRDEENHRDKWKEAGKLSNVSMGTIAKVKVIEEKATEQQKKRLEKGKSSVSAVYREVKRIDKKEEIEKIPPQELKGKYNVFLADPPWQYEQAPAFMRGMVDDHYPTMDVEAIKKLPIKDMSLDNAVLFLWTTAVMIRKAFAVMEAWGFEFKTSMVWVKSHIGTGFYVRSKHEIILIGVKGSFLPMTTDIPESVFFADKGKHSEKPEILYEIIEKMYPGQKKIELFARKAKAGWTSWGNEL